MNGKINKTVSELGYQTGLKVRGTTAFGSYNGYLVCLCPVPATASYNLTIAFPHREDTYRVQLMNVKPMLKSIGAMGQSQVEPGLLHIGIVSKFKVPDAPKLRGFMDDVIRELSMITPR